MAIEIKELIVRFSVDNQNETRNVGTAPSLDSKVLKDIVNQCKQEVLEQLIQMTER